MEKSGADNNGRQSRAVLKTKQADSRDQGCGNTGHYGRVFASENTRKRYPILGNGKETVRSGEGLRRH